MEVVGVRFNFRVVDRWGLQSTSSLIRYYVPYSDDTLFRLASDTHLLPMSHRRCIGASILSRVFLVIIMSVSTRRSLRSQSSCDTIDSSAALGQWPATHGPLRDAVAYILISDKIAGFRCTPDQLVTPLNILVGADGSEDVDFVDEDFLIKSAFSNCGNDFHASYEAILELRREGMDASMPG